MFPNKTQKIKPKDNSSVMNITASILNRLNFEDVNDRLSMKHRETLPQMSARNKRKKKHPRKALNELNCNSFMMIENINQIRLERMGKSILEKKAFHPLSCAKQIENYILEISEMLINYLSLEDYRSTGKMLQFRKCVDERELKQERNNHFLIRSKNRLKGRCKSVDLKSQRQNQQEISTEQLYCILAQNPDNSLNFNNQNKSNLLLEALKKKNPHIIYNRFSEKLVGFLKLNLKKKLTGQVSSKDMVITVRNTFKSKEEMNTNIVIGKSKPIF
jgi:hypothetical protein